jgi:hypothetical protein
VARLSGPKDRDPRIRKRTRGNADLDPKKVWQDALAKGVTDPGLIIACADFLFDREQYDHAAEFLKAELRLGIVARPWVYEALTIALQESKASSDEIERAQLSVLDLEPQDAQGYLRASKAMADSRRYDRALAFCRQASILEPNTSRPYADALVYAEQSKDAEAMEWAAGNLLSRDWPVDSRQLHEKAADRFKSLGRLLKAEKRQADAERMSAAVERNRVRDLVIHLSWQGEADLDLEVTEPLGTTCSFLHRQTPGGGTLIGDNLDDLSNETYTAAQAFPGEYQVTLRRIWGRPLGSRATVEVIQHQGTPQETRTRQSVTFDRTHTLKVALQDGRRTSVAQVPPPGSLQRPKPATTAANPDRVLNQLRALSDPDLVYDGGMNGNASSYGSVASERSGALGPQDFAGTSASYAGKLPAAIQGGMELTTQAALSKDRRYVRLSVAPVFETLGQNQTASVVVNPVIPGGTETIGR